MPTRTIASLLLAAVLSGCVVDDPLAGDSRDACGGHAADAAGVHPGAWENATRPGSPFGNASAWPGVPVGPRVAALLGTAGNVSSVRWRVDGGPVDEVEFTSWRDGRLVSPEFITLAFHDQAWVDGVLDPAREPDDAAAVVERFLDAVRGDRPDNADLAAGLVPALSYSPQIGWSDDQGNRYDPPEPPEAEPLPGPWAVSSHLAAHASNGTLRDGQGSVRFVDGAWSWTVELPATGAGWGYAPGASWHVSVDARDRVHVLLGSNVTLDEPALRARLADVLSSHGLHDVDLDGWELDPDAGHRDLCPPRYP